MKPNRPLQTQVNSTRGKPRAMQSGGPSAPMQSAPQDKQAAALQNGPGRVNWFQYVRCEGRTAGKSVDLRGSSNRDADLSQLSSAGAKKPGGGFASRF
jgi:hypothetical protein